MELLELEKLGNQLAKDFTVRNKPLTENLIKVASSHNLNKEQTNRVAEIANIETYLELVKTARDKYVEFPLADSAKAWESINKAKEDPSVVAEYEDIKKNAEVTEIFDMYKSLTKMASPRVTKESEILKLAGGRRYQDTLEFIDNNIGEALVTFNSNFTKLASEVKQYLLSDIGAGDIFEIVKMGAQNISDPLIQMLKETLSPVLQYRVDLEKTANHKIPNLDSDIYKLTWLLDDTYSQLMKLAEAYISYNNEYISYSTNKDIHCFTKYAQMSSEVSNLLRWMNDHPRTTGAAAVLIAYKAGKATEPETKVISPELATIELKRYGIR